MKQRPLLLAILALFGLFVGEQLTVLTQTKPVKALVVGEHVSTARLSPDQKYIAGIGSTPRNIWFLQIWSSDGEVVLPPQKLPNTPGRFHSFDWSADSREVAVAAGSEVWLFHPKAHSKKVLAAAPLVRFVQFRGDSLLARSDSQTLIWRGKNHKKAWRLSQKYLLHADLDKEGRRLATSCFEDGVRVFDVKTKKQLQHLEPGSTVCGVKFSRQGQWVSFGPRVRGDRNRDRVVTFDLAKNRLVGPPLSCPGLRGFAVSDDGQTVVSSHRDTACVWNPQSAEVISQKALKGRLLDVLSPGGKWVASVPQAAKTQLWKSSNESDTQQLDSDSLPSDLAFASEKYLLVVDGRITLWRLP